MIMRLVEWNEDSNRLAVLFSDGSMQEFKLEGDSFMDKAMTDFLTRFRTPQELTATGAVISAVEANPLAIGYASLSAVGDTVKMVTVGGVECSEETVKDGSYEVQRPFVFVTNKSVTLSEQAQAFFDFATSADAADLIRTAGAVPVNE